MNEFNLKKDNEEKGDNIKISPIRISYHGKEHYNSIIPRKNNYEIWINCRFGVLTQNPGEYEEQILKKKIEENKEKKEEKKEIEESRKLFVQTKDKYLDDMLLDLLLNENGKNDKNIIEQSKLEYKKEQDDLLKKAIKESIDDSKKIEDENKNKKILIIIFGRK